MFKVKLWGHVGRVNDQILVAYLACADLACLHQRLLNLLHYFVECENFAAIQIGCSLNQLLLSRMEQENVSAWFIDTRVSTVRSSLEPLWLAKAILIKVFDAFRLFLHRLEVLFAPWIVLFDCKWSIMRSLPFLIGDQVVFVFVALAVLTCNNTFRLEARCLSCLLFFFVDEFNVLFGSLSCSEFQLLIIVWLVSKRYHYSILQVMVCVELDTPAQLVAKNLGNFEMWLNISAQNTLEVSFCWKHVNSESRLIIKLARRQFKVDNQIRHVSSEFDISRELDKASIDDSVHRHAKQIDHHLDKEILLDGY